MAQDKQPGLLAIAEICAHNAFKDLQTVRMEMHRAKQAVPNEAQMRTIRNQISTFLHAIDCIERLKEG